VTNGPLVTVGVKKTDVLEYEPFPQRPRHLGGARRRSDRRLHLKEVEQVFEKERLFEYAASAHEQPLNEIAAALK
jgi:hypothetical protein